MASFIHDFIFYMILMLFVIAIGLSILFNGQGTFNEQGVKIQKSFERGMLSIGDGAKLRIENCRVTGDNTFEYTFALDDVTLYYSGEEKSMEILPVAEISGKITAAAKPISYPADSAERISFVIYDFQPKTKERFLQITFWKNTGCVKEYIKRTDRKLSEMIDICGSSYLASVGLYDTLNPESECYKSVCIAYGDKETKCKSDSRCYWETQIQIDPNRCRPCDTSEICINYNNDACTQCAYPKSKCRWAEIERKIFNNILPAYSCVDKVCFAKKDQECKNGCYKHDEGLQYKSSCLKCPLIEDCAYNKEQCSPKTGCNTILCEWRADSCFKKSCTAQETGNKLAGTECIVCMKKGVNYMYDKDDSKCASGKCGSDGRCITTCNPGESKAGTSCLVCSADGTTYIQDDSRCTNSKCRTDGTCGAADRFSISGTVTDENNNPLSEAFVDVKKVGKNEMPIGYMTKRDGNYIITDIPEGAYEIRVEKECYSLVIVSFDIKNNIKNNFQLMAVNNIDRVEINPRSTSVGMGQFVKFSAFAYDSEKRGMPLIGFSWSMDNNIGIISSVGDSGTFIAEKTGTTTVRAEASCGTVTKTASATVTVLPEGTFVLKKCSEADATIKNKIDYVLAPDESYSSIEDFKDDVENKYLPALFSTEPIASNKDKFNIYYYDGKAKCGPDSLGRMWCDKPSGLDNACKFADVIGIIHTSQWRDYAQANVFTADEPMALVHETGHALFDLYDEYCCNGGYQESTKYPYPNIFRQQDKCQKQLNDNAINNRCKKICKDEDQGDPPCGNNCECINWYKQEGKSIMNSEKIYDKFSENNLLRINWFFANAIK